MNIQDAIKSGKPFRRKSWTHADYIYFDRCEYMGGTTRYLKDDAYTSFQFKDDLIANDFEVKEETTKKITLYRYLVLTRGFYPYYYFTSWNSKKEIDTIDNHNNPYEIVKTETKEIEIEVKGEH